MRGERGDEGAAAVVFTILMLALLVVAAVAVDISKLYLRDTAVQSSADLAAFAGAQGLPDVCEAFAQALHTLNEEGNAVQDDGPGDLSVAATPAAMSDGDPVDGEIEVLRRYTPGVAVEPADRLDTTSCTGAAAGGDPQAGPGRVVRVTTPGRTVAFAFANVFSVFPGGEPVGSSAEVRARATVGLRAPEGTTVLPVFLPAGCVGPTGGPAVLGAGPPPPPARDPVYDPPGADDGPVVVSVTPDVVAFTSAPVVRVRLDGLAQDPGTSPVAVDLHPGDGGARVPPDPAGALPVTVVGMPQGVVSEDGLTRWTAEVEVALPAAVTSTSGVWYLRASQPVGGWSADEGAGELTVGPPPLPPGPCEGSTTVRLGLLDGGGPGAPDAGAFVTGLQLPALDTSCPTDGTPPGDLLPPGDGATCLRVLDLPEDALPALLTAGLLGEGAGRLASQDPAACSTPSGLPDPVVVGGVRVSDGTLSCHLALREDGSGRHTLADVLAGTPGSLGADVVADPRFALVPVLATSRRPADGTWPVASFRGAFVTDETVGSPATCTSDTDCNGLVLDGSRVREVTVLTFPLSALPVSVEQPGNGADWVGGTKDFLLLD